MGSQFVLLRVIERHCQFLGNFIYAKCNMFERQVLWDALNSFRMGEKSCLFASDFNILHSDLEMKGGRPRPRVAMEDFNSWIHQGGLIEMNS